MSDDYDMGQHRHHGDDAGCPHHDSRAGPDHHVDVGCRGCFLEVDRVSLPVGYRSSDRGLLLVVSVVSSPLLVVGVDGVLTAVDAVGISQILRPSLTA